MKLKFILLVAMLAAESPSLADPGVNGDQTFDWCTRYKQRYGYQAPDGPLQPCFQVDQYRGNGDDSRSVGVRGDNRQNGSEADATGVLSRQALSMEMLGVKGPSGAEMIAVNGRMGLLENQLDKIDDRFRQGIAATVAMTPVQIPSAPGKFTYALNGATYRGAYATGGSMMYRLNTRNPMAIGVGFSRSGSKNSAVRFGIAGEF